MQQITFPMERTDVFILVNKKGKILHSVHTSRVYVNQWKYAYKKTPILIDKLSDDDLRENNEEGVWHSSESMSPILKEHKDVLKGFKEVKVTIIRNTTFEIHN